MKTKFLIISFFIFFSMKSFSLELQLYCSQENREIFYKDEYMRVEKDVILKGGKDVILKGGKDIILIKQNWKIFINDFQILINERDILPRNFELENQYKGIYSGDNYQKFSNNWLFGKSIIIDRTVASATILELFFRHNVYYIRENLVNCSKEKPEILF